MELKQKQRLVGALVIALAALLLLPWLLDGTGYREMDLEVVIPPEPQMSAPRVFRPQQQEREPTRTLADLSAAVPPPAADTEKESALELTEKPQLDQEGVPVAWTLQLASFQDGDNASALRDRLVKDGYTAYIRKSNKLNKVYVGPDLQRGSLERLRLRIQRDYRLDGLILRFTTD